MTRLIVYMEMLNAKFPKRDLKQFRALTNQEFEVWYQNWYKTFNLGIVAMAQMRK